MAFRTAPHLDTDLYGTVLTGVVTSEFNSDDDWGTRYADCELRTFGTREGHGALDESLYHFPEERICMGEAI